MVYILLGTGFEEMEALTPVDLMRRAGISVLTVGLNGKTVYGGHGIGVEADITIEEMDLFAAEMLVVPGGLGGVASIRGCEKAMNALSFAWENGKYLAAICAGPTVLADLHITDGLHVTCYPGCESQMGSAIVEANKACVQDDLVITGTSAGCAIPFSLQLIQALKGSEAAQTVANQIVMR